MSKILMIVAPNEYQDAEFEIPRDTFAAAGHKVIVASDGVELATGAFGGSTKVDVDINEVKAADYDCFVFVGGRGAGSYFHDTNLRKLVLDAHESGKVLGAICIAPSILANADILSGRKVTAFPSEEGNLRAKGAEYTGESVEVDGKIVTANGPPAAPVFAEEILKLLA